MKNDNEFEKTRRNTDLLREKKNCKRNNNKSANNKIRIEAPEQRISVRVLSYKRDVRDYN